MLQDTCHTEETTACASGDFQTGGGSELLPTDYVEGCRLLYVVGQLGAGGLERQLYYLLLAMDRKRFKPAVVAWNYREDDVLAQQIRSLGLLVFSLGDIPPYRKLIELRRLVSALKPEILHSYSFYTNVAAWWATRLSGVIAIGSIRNNFVTDRRLAGPIIGPLSARWPADQICNSAAAQRAVEQTWDPFKPVRLQVVRNRMDIASFNVVGTPPGPPTLLAVGRLHTEKRWDRLLEVVATLNKSGLAFSIRHIGDGPLSQSLKAHARRLGVDHVIHFVGMRRDIPDQLAQSAFLIHTADDEGCPNVVMEAMACGRAVVATDAGDVPFLVDDGKTGYLVRRGDDEMLADRMASLIQNPELCVRMGQAGRQKAEQEFDLSKLVDQTFHAYRAAGWNG